MFAQTQDMVRAVEQAALSAPTPATQSLLRLPLSPPFPDGHLSAGEVQAPSGANQK